MNEIMADIPKKIVWLASYPKSGNTWFRAFLTALLNDGELDINKMKSDGMFSLREVFDDFTGLDSTYLDMEEVNSIRPRVFEQLAQSNAKDAFFNKIHDAYTFSGSGQPLIPSACTKCAIYFIRNPLDIAGSLASHMNITIDEAIMFMNNNEQTLASQKNNLNTHNHFKQLVLSWSGHVESWSLKMPFPILVIRYEDMIKDTFNTFSNAISFLGFNNTERQIKQAIASCSFENLKEKEAESGFEEKVTKLNSFFRKGKSDNWEEELTTEQSEAIIAHHSDIMKLHGY